MHRRCVKGNAQLGLGLPEVSAGETTLRAAYAELGLRLPFEQAMRLPALSICVRNFAEARARGRRR